MTKYDNLNGQIFNVGHCIELFWNTLSDIQKINKNSFSRLKHNLI